MWGSSKNSTMSRHKIKENETPVIIPILHNNLEYDAVEVCWGSQFTLVIGQLDPKYRKKNWENTTSIKYDDNQMESLIEFLNYLLTSKDYLIDGEWITEHFTSLKQIISKSSKLYKDNKDYEDESSDDENPDFFEDYFVDAKVFETWMKKIIKHPEFSSRCRNIYKIDEQFIDEFVKDKSTIYMGEFDERIYWINKSEGVLFAVGYTTPKIFNIFAEDDEYNPGRDKKIRIETYEMKDFCMI